MPMEVQFSVLKNKSIFNKRRMTAIKLNSLLFTR
jgi:hypothetical protein